MYMYGLMTACAFVMMWANNKSKKTKVTWGRPVAALFGVIAVSLAIIQTVISMTPTWPAKDILEREMGYTRAQTQVLGETIARNHAGAKILLITDPETQGTRDRIKMMRESIEKGLGGSGKVVATEAPKQYFITAQEFDQMLDAHPECNLVISLMGLPYDFQEMAFWTKSDGERQKLVVINGNFYDLRKAFMANYIQVAVVHRPDIKYDVEGEIPDDYKAAFEKRFILITPKTVNQVADQFPNMFKPLSDEDKDNLSEPIFVIPDAATRSGGGEP